ncbi:MAG: hypothetical protein QOI51_2300 [Nocardioidaceae bacterium]|jgi:hypothetical protein|nr:hypothetical protein [Nocardioidaceae bacterium]
MSCDGRSPMLALDEIRAFPHSADLSELVEVAARAAADQAEWSRAPRVGPTTASAVSEAECLANWARATTRGRATAMGGPNSH